MFSRYELLLLKTRDGQIRNIRIGGWIVFLFFILLIFSLVTSGYLFYEYAKTINAKVELNTAKQIIKQQDSRMLGIVNQIEQYEKDLRRVQQFDTKLRVIMNINDEVSLKDTDVDKEERLLLDGRAYDIKLLGQHRELFARRLNRLVDDLNASTNLEEIKQQELVLYLRNNSDLLLSTPSIWPAKGYLTSGFAWRTSPITGKSQFHKGIDIANKIGTPIWAPAKGVVTFTGVDGGYGLSVVIDHGNGVTTRYAHLNKISVANKQQVQRGDVIGAIGNSGRSTGPHLHYEVHVNGVPVDPMRYILN